MCWSFEVSLATSFLVYSTVFYLFRRNASPRDRWNATFLLIFGTMQFIDLLLWSLSKYESLSDCSFTNRLITRIGFYIIILEPASSLFARHLYGEKTSWKERIIYYILIGLLPYLSRDVFLFPECQMRYCTQITDKNHLLFGIGLHQDGSSKCWKTGWAWGEFSDEIPLLLRIIFLATISYPYLFMKPFFSGLLQIIILIGSWIVGLMSDSHASIWCLANVAQIVTMIIDPFIFGKSPEKYKPKIRSKYESILTDRYSKKEVPENLDAIIIGSGIGGLSTAALLAKANKKVLVLEQHYRAGGCTHTFDELGGLFDSGIHYVGSKDILDMLLSYTCINPPEFHIMGNKENQYLYDRFEIGPDFWIEYRKGWEAIEKELISKFPHEIKGIKALKKIRSKASYVAYLIAFIKLLPSWTPKFITDYLLKKLENLTAPTAIEVVSKLFKDPKLIALISAGQLIDWNLKPDRVSWFVVVAMMNYYMNGGYYPVGGSHLMAEGIIPVIERAGGRVLCRAEIEKILINDKGKAYGVQLKNKDIITANIIISNAGIENTRVLLEDKETNNQDVMPALPPSNGHMTAFITLEGSYKEFGIDAANIHSWPDLNKYNYDVSKMQEDFYKSPFNQKGCLITLTCPSAKDPIYDQKFPNECNVLMLSEGIMDWFNFDCGVHGNRSEQYNAFKNKFEEMFIQRLYQLYPKAQNKIKQIEIGSPLTTKYFLYAKNGESYGAEYTPKRFSKTVMEKLHPKTKIEGLYICGEASFFGGLAGAMVSGWITATHVLGVWGTVKLLGMMEKEKK